MVPIIYYVGLGLLALTGCLTTQNIGDPIDGGKKPNDGEPDSVPDGPLADAVIDGPLADADIDSDGPRADGPPDGAIDVYIGPDGPLPDGPSDAEVDGPPDGPPDAMPDAPPLAEPECASPAPGSLFQPNEEGLFSPLEWTTTVGVTYLLRLWKLPDPGALPEAGELLFEGDVGSAGSTTAVTAFPGLDYRTDYLWEVIACSVSDPDNCLSSGLCQFTTTHHGLVGWWRFDEGEGDIATDWSGNGNNGTLLGEDGLPIRTEGVSGEALLLDGVDDNVLIGDVATLEGMDALTVEVWINTTTSEGNKKIISKWASTPNSYVLRTDASGEGKVSFGANTDLTLPEEPTVEVISTNPIDDGNWHYVVGVYDGAQQFVCVDGICGSALSQSGTIRDSDSPLCFGALCYPDDGILTTPFTGQIDEVAIYNRALASEEIGQNCQRYDLMGDICDN